MTNYSANNLSLLYSAIIGGSVFGTLFISSFIFSLDLNIGIILATSFVCMLVSFFILRYLLFNYLYNRIRLIYKTINKRKTGKTGHAISLDHNLDLISKVEDDVSKWADEQEKEMNRMREMNNYRKEFVGNVSHELKTPIFNIQGYTLTLLEGGLEDESINKKYLKKIEKNINRMTTIVNDLDLITRLESGQLKLRLESFSPIVFCNEIIESLEEIYLAKSVKIDVIKHYEKSFFVNADREFMRQVFTNLFINAIHYNDENGNIKAEFFEMDKSILVEITDDGIGIPEEDLPRVFERFYRVDKSRSLNSGGSGLGLAIVKHIIDAHEQTVNVRSTLGLGTTIAFTMSKSE
ncbi:MAG: two-component sensor histidine kinase [Marinilabiliales bacterium]|nr:MAG: two-component sensor histidine kinase [Marinilabiliales bacterium]